MDDFRSKGGKSRDLKQSLKWIWNRESGVKMRLGELASQSATALWAVWAGLGVEAFVGEAQALDGAAGDEVLVDDLCCVFRADVAVPDGLRVDDYGGAVFALIEAASLVDADPGAKAGRLDELLDCGVEFALAVGVAGGAWGILGAGVGADKDVALKWGQTGTPSKIG